MEKLVQCFFHYSMLQALVRWELMELKMLLLLPGSEGEVVEVVEEAGAFIMVGAMVKEVKTFIASVLYLVEKCQTGCSDNT